MHVILGIVLICSITGCTTKAPLDIINMPPHTVVETAWQEDEANPRKFHKKLGGYGAISVENDGLGTELLVEVSRYCRWLSRAKTYLVFERFAEIGLHIACDGTIDEEAPTGIWPTYVADPPEELLY